MSAGEVLVKMVPESLVHQCQLFVAMNLNAFPIDYLSLLPLTTREELLYSLPVADVCQLEDTKFVEGIHMTKYWTLPYDVSLVHDNSKILKQYVEKHWTDTQVYAKMVLYGQCVACLVEHRFRLDSDWCRSVSLLQYPHNAKPENNTIMAFLYAVRKFSWKRKSSTCEVELVFPPRYHHESSLSKESDKREVEKAVVKCFKEELPKVMASLNVCEGSHSLKCLIEDYAHLLQELIYLGIWGEWRNDGFKFLQMVMKEASKIEVLVLEGSIRYFSRSSPNSFLQFLSSSPTFLSTLRVLKVALEEPDEHENITVSRGAFDQFITAYFSTPTDHQQNVHFCKMDITTNDVDCISPKIDPLYQELKSITLEECTFAAKYDANSKAVSHWLDQNIQVDSEVNGCHFYVKDTSVRKRKFSEIQL